MVAATCSDSDAPPDAPVSAGGVKAARVSGSICEPCTSSGMSIHTGPGRPVVARCSASSRWRRMDSGSVTVTAYFVSERTTETMSTSCAPTERTPESPFMSARFTWPEMKMHGVESSHAPARPVTALVPPGPVVTKAAPSPSVALA